MKAKFLQPMTLQDDYYDDIEKRVNAIFYASIFEPLFAAARDLGAVIKNSAPNPAVEAMKAGRIFYDDGVIKGSYNASISKALREMGGLFDKRAKVWHLSFLPAEMQFAIAESEAVADKMLTKFLHVLDSANVARAIEEEPLTHAYSKSLRKMDTDFTDIVSKVAIPPKITPEAREAIAKSWGDNLDLYIKGWADESILKLRTKVTSNAMRGQRAGNMVREIMAEYGVSRRKAKFLARQETALLMSNFQQERYKGLGITKYRWSGAMDQRERPDHKRLEGKIFMWDSPPITDLKTGARNNPGQDFSCRCTAVPIVESAL